MTEQRGHFLVDHQGRKTLEVHCLRPGHQVPVSHLRCVVSTSTSAQSSSGWGTRSIDGRTLERVLLQRVLGAARHVGGRSKRAHGEACDEAMRAPFALRSIVVLIQSPPSSHLLLLHDHTTLWTRVANRHLVYRVCLWCSHHACSTCFRGCGRIAVGVGSVQARGRLVSAGTRQSMLRVLALARVHCRAAAARRHVPVYKAPYVQAACGPCVSGCASRAARCGCGQACASCAWLEACP